MLSSCISLFLSQLESKYLKLIFYSDSFPPRRQGLQLVCSFSRNTGRPDEAGDNQSEFLNFHSGLFPLYFIVCALRDTTAIGYLLRLFYP